MMLNVYVVREGLLNDAKCVCKKKKSIKIMPYMYVVGKKLSKSEYMSMQEVKNYQNHAKFVCST